MFDIKKIKEIIDEEIAKSRKMGEHAGGSGHLAFRSIIKFELSEPKEIQHKGNLAYELTCKYDIYTETEFLHPPEEDEVYTEHYTDKFLFDKDSNIIELSNDK